MRSNLARLRTVKRCGGAIAIASVCFLVACGNGDEGSPESAAARFAIEQSDLPPGYEVAADETETLSGEECIEDARKTSQRYAEPFAQLKVQSCHRAKFRRQTETTSSELVSASFDFPDGGLAKRAMPILKQALSAGTTAGTRATDIPPPKLGDQALAMQFEGSPPVAGSMVMWRRGSSVTMVGGFYTRGEFEPQDIFQLGQKVDARATA